MIRFYDYDLSHRFWGQQVLFRRMGYQAYGVCIYSENEMYSVEMRYDNSWDQEWNGLPIFIDVTPKKGEEWVGPEGSGVVVAVGVTDVKWYNSETEEEKVIDVVEFLLKYKNEKLDPLEEDRTYRELFGFDGN
jgi:hypothetical protein